MDLVLCDLPYGVTACAWDTKIDAARLWVEYRRVLKVRGVVVLFGAGRFAHELVRTAPRGWFRHEWVWDKRAASGWLNARRMPMPAHELVLVFGIRVPYFPQGVHRVRVKYREARVISTVYRGERKAGYIETRSGWPTTMLRIAREKGAAPAQKPIALLEYLVRTYTRKGGLVLDNAMGLGSTGVAAVNCGRRFVGMEMDAARFGVARKRVLDAEALRRGGKQ